MRITGRAARGPLVATVELSLCHDAASEAADSSKPGFHRQMISIAAAITIPVTNPVKQENSSRSLRTTLMAASPCGPWSILRAQRTPLPWRKSDLVESTANLFQAYFATTLSVSRFVAKTWPAFRSSWQESGRAVPSRGIRWVQRTCARARRNFWRCTSGELLSRLRYRSRVRVGHHGDQVRHRGDRPDQANRDHDADYPCKHWHPLYVALSLPIGLPSRREVVHRCPSFFEAKAEEGPLARS